MAAIKHPIQILHCLFLAAFFSESFHSGFGSCAKGLHSCLFFFFFPPPLAGETKVNVGDVGLGFYFLSSSL